MKWWALPITTPVKGLTQCLPGDMMSSTYNNTCTRINTVPTCIDNMYSDSSYQTVSQVSHCGWGATVEFYLYVYGIHTTGCYQCVPWSVIMLSYQESVSGGLYRDPNTDQLIQNHHWHDWCLKMQGVCSLYMMSLHSSLCNGAQIPWQIQLTMYI